MARKKKAEEVVAHIEIELPKVEGVTVAEQRALAEEIRRSWRQTHWHRAAQYNVSKAMGLPQERLDAFLTEVVQASKAVQAVDEMIRQLDALENGENDEAADDEPEQLMLANGQLV